MSSVYAGWLTMSDEPLANVTTKLTNYGVVSTDQQIRDAGLTDLASVTENVNPFLFMPMNLTLGTPLV